MQDLQVDVLRLSPQLEGMEEIVMAFDAARRGVLSDAINTLLASKHEWCNGYWHGEAGMLNIDAVLK